MIYILIIIFIIGAGVIIQCTSQLTAQNKQQKAALYIAFVFFIGWVVMGFRGISVGKDTINYYNIYSNITQLQLNQIFARSDIEPSWAMLAWINNAIGGSFLSFQLIISGIICELSRRYITKISLSLNGYHVLCITIIFFFYIYLISFNISRQMLSVILIANAWNELRVAHQLKSLLIFLLATSFHYSAILAFPIFVLWILKDKKYILQSSIIILIVFYLSISILTKITADFGIYVNYTTNDANVFQKAKLAKIIWIVIGMLSIWTLISRNNTSSGIKICGLYSLIYVVLNLISSEVSYIERISLYYVPFVCIPYIVFGNHIRHVYLRTLYFSGIIGLYTIWFLLSSQSPQYIYFINSDI